MTARFAVAGMGVFCPQFPNLVDWLKRSERADPAEPTGELLDKRSRRRASPLTKAFADAYQQALEQAGLAPEAVGSVFGSALGEAGTMIGLLDQMWREGGALSPMRFATSVHNAAAGVVSIATRNEGFTTSLGADFDTPGMALLEAMAMATAHGQAVMVACADEAAPIDLVTDGRGWGFASAAIALVEDGAAAAALPRITVPSLGTPSLAPPDLPAGLADNPQAGLLDLIDSLARGQEGVLRLDRGRGRGYCVEITRPA